MVVTSRQVTLRDFLIFQAKLAVDGMKDLVVFQASIVAMLVDVVSGRGERPRWFYSVLRASERFDRWLDLHGAARVVRYAAAADARSGEAERGFSGVAGAR